MNTESNDPRLNPVQFQGVEVPPLLWMELSHDTYWNNFKWSKLGSDSAVTESGLSETAFHHTLGFHDKNIGSDTSIECEFIYSRLYNQLLQSDAQFAACCVVNQ